MINLIDQRIDDIGDQGIDAEIGVQVDSGADRIDSS